MPLIENNGEKPGAREAKLREAIRLVTSGYFDEVTFEWFPAPLSDLRVAQYLGGIRFTAVDDEEARFSAFYKHDAIPSLEIIQRDIAEIFRVWVENEVYSLGFDLSVCEKTTEEDGLLKISVCEVPEEA